MTKPKSKSLVLGIVAALTVAALGASIATWRWGNVGERVRALGADARRSGVAVDTRPLSVAQQVAQLAETRTERGYAADALRLADYSVDFAFAAAIHKAASAPATSNETTRAATERLKAATDAVLADSGRVAALTQQAAKGSGPVRDAAIAALDLARAHLELDQDDAEDAHQDLVRAGGDRIASIQRLRTQHDSSLHATAAPTTAAAPEAAAAAAPSIELTKSSNLVDQVQAWRSLATKRQLVNQARDGALDRAAGLTEAHDTLEKQVAAERVQQQILHRKGHNAGDATLARRAGDTGRGRTAVDSPSRGVTPPSLPSSPLAFLQDLAADQKDLSELDKRIDNEQDLAATYATWSKYLQVRQQRFVHGIFQQAFWVLLIALLVVGANAGVQRVFSDVALQHRKLHTLRTVTLFSVQVAGVLIILLLIFGMPSNFAAVVALAGAGLALALQDFILGFFGWFILMGKDGIRPGDWVEINGVGGEVLEVGVFQTVLLETSNWSESGHPTGRKVSFVNSFAIQGHYFNFSTSGQWLWDELELQVGDGPDPYAVAEEIQRLAESETAANADAAEEEWRRAVPARVREEFSAVPTVMVRPTGSGVTVRVRYLTRASARAEIRAKMYRAMIELLHRKEA